MDPDRERLPFLLDFNTPQFATGERVCQVFNVQGAYVHVRTPSPIMKMFINHQGDLRGPSSHVRFTHVSFSSEHGKRRGKGGLTAPKSSLHAALEPE